MTSLPILNEAELRAIFREDERAIWRYRLLSSLLVDGIPTREVAEEFGTTTETVRQLRNAFSETGHLDTLRSRRRGAAGHLKRQSILAQAVAQALAADPEASGGTIWRRVQEELADASVAVPRRSVYRLVEQLRPHPEANDESALEDMWAPALVPTLRAALPLLALDPPEELGRSALAEQLVGGNDDPLERGRHLHKLLMAALTELGPGPDDLPQDPIFRPYFILRGEALEGRQREELERELHVATATYTRAKRQGLERVAELVVTALQRQQRNPAPTVPPEIPNLLDRERERAYYERRLEAEGLAIVWGLPGTGKTALALAIAHHHQAAGEHVIWHECSGQSEALIQNLLQSFGVDHDQQYLNPESLLLELRVQLRANDLLVLDAYDRVADDPMMPLIAAMLRGSVASGGTRILLVSRALPEWAHDLGWPLLGGLAPDAARALWTLHGGEMLDAPQWQMLLNQTLGFPRLLQTMVATPEASLEAYVRALCNDLSEEARRMLALAALSGRSLHDSSVQDSPALTELTEHGLLWKTRRDTWAPHTLLYLHRNAVRAALKDIDIPHDQLALEAIQDGDWTDAATYLAGDDNAAAARIIIEHAEAIVGRFEGGKARDLLLMMLAGQPSQAHRMSIEAALGRIYLAMGWYQQAIDALAIAIELAHVEAGNDLPTSLAAWQAWSAEAHLHLGAWQRALPTLQANLHLVDARTRPSQYQRLAFLQQQTWSIAGHSEQAHFWLADLQMQLLAHPDPLFAALVAYAEGRDALDRGQVMLATERLEHALASFQPLIDVAWRWECLIHLLDCYAACDRLAEALALVERELLVARSLSHRYGIAMLLAARARILLAQGDDGRAAESISGAEAVADPANVRLSANLLITHGMVARSRGLIGNALEYCLLALSKVEDPPQPRLTIDANLELATALFDGSDAISALQYAMRALRLASTIGLQRPRLRAQLMVAREALLRRAPDEALQLLTDVTVDEGDIPLQGSVAELQAWLANEPMQSVQA